MINQNAASLHLKNASSKNARGLFKNGSETNEQNINTRTIYSSMAGSRGWDFFKTANAHGSLRFFIHVVLVHCRIDSNIHVQPLTKCAISGNKWPYRV